MIPLSYTTILLTSFGDESNVSPLAFSQTAGPRLATHARTRRTAAIAAFRVDFVARVRA
jgi:hypothetical protein